MAIYRNVQMSFWTDPEIADDYTPKDKLFYLYVLTNTHTNLCGCYQVSVKQMAYEIGYSNKEIEELIDRAEYTFKKIAYSNTTKELLILNWSKYNWTTSEKFRITLEKEIQKVKEQQFKTYLDNLFNGIDTVFEFPDTVLDEEEYGIEKDYMLVSVNNTDTVNVNDGIKQIVNYLNSKCNTKYKASSVKTKGFIKARIAEGYTLEDFYKVIDNKVADWKGKEHEKFLRPETLFGTKFEGYLNQKINQPQGKSNVNDFEHRNYDYASLNKNLFGGQQ